MIPNWPEAPLDSADWLLALLLALVLVVPLIAERLRVPPIVGLILAGALIGPGGLNLVERAGAVAVLGTMGLLYLMFLAGLELDLEEFVTHRRDSILFGAVTFVVPMALGFGSTMLLGFGVLAAILIASCWASHTLLTYPVFRRHGTVANRAVSTGVGGTIVGSSGTILTLEMATAMNRSVANILFAGFGAAPGAGVTVTEERPVTSINAQDAAIKLAYADSVVIVPGYGLAVAQAQHAVKEMADELERHGVEVSYAIHPVAGRMPGHMNVLLAEADVPYEKLREMDEINPELPRTDVAVVIGANDVTNPAAKSDPDSPIAGMPIIEVDEAQQIIVIKRSLSPGFAGIDNDLFYHEKTSMLFSDAKQAAAEIAAEVQNL